MRVKATRIGYYKRLRQVGDEFMFDGKVCPSWCDRIVVRKPALKKKEE